MAMHDLAENRKFKMLCHRLGKPPYQAWGVLDMLWAQAHRDVNPKFHREEVEVMVGWEGEAGALVEALIQCRWLDAVDGSEDLEIHDYWEHCPHYVTERLRKREERRRKRPGHVQDASGTHLQRVQPTDTDTDTKTSTRKRSRSPNTDSEGSRNGAASEPSRVSEIGFGIGRLTQNGQKAIEDTVQRISKASGEPEWRDWWREVCVAVWECRDQSGWNLLVDSLDKVEDASSAGAGSAFDAPGQYLVKRLTAWMKAHGLRWPRFPATAREKVTT